jgi:arsenate reductase
MLDEVTQLSSALSDPTRVRILASLLGGRDEELCVCEVTDLFDLAPSTVSKHLLLLRQAGLVEGRKDGKWMFYRPSRTPGPLAREALGWVRRAAREDEQLKADAARLREVQAAETACCADAPCCPATGPRPQVLFLCTGNSCRSQMAEGWAKALKSDVIEAFSAGTSPHGMNLLAIRAMAEVGVDISGHSSKRPGDLGIEFDYVVTVCDSAHESCSLFPARTRVIHVGFDDPPRLAKGAKSEDDAMPHYRRVRDEIKAFIRTLPESLSAQEVRSCKEILMSTVKVFDPPMCCSSGVCGTDPDIALARFAADLQWLQGQGVAVERFTLSQQPEKFTADAAVLKAVSARGTGALPIVMVNDQIVAEGQYPRREQLAAKLGLIAGAATSSPKAGGCGCQPGKCC